MKYICSPCADKHGLTPQDGLMVTVHEGVCDSCRKIRVVSHVRGYDAKQKLKNLPGFHPRQINK